MAIKKGYQAILFIFLAFCFWVFSPVFAEKMSLVNGSGVPCKRLEGKVVIITGGASGIGESAVRLFHEHGAKVVIADIQDDHGREIADDLGDGATYVHCDVSKEEDVSSLVDAAVAKYGKLDVMYNNAGVIDKPIGGILETTKPDLDKVLGINVVGAFWGAKHAARVMIPAKTGCILFTTSVATVIAGLSTHAYAASKHAVLGLAKSVAAEVGEHGIRVNCVSPYTVATGIAGPRSAEQARRMEEIVSSMGNLQGSILKARDIAMAAVYLASDEAGYVSGLNLVVDGGFSVVNPTFNNVMKAHKLK